MAKKKSKKKRAADTRGYSTTSTITKPPPPPPPTPSSSSTATAESKKPPVTTTISSDTAADLANHNDTTSLSSLQLPSITTNDTVTTTTTTTSSSKITNISLSTLPNEYSLPSSTPPPPKNTPLPPPSSSNPITNNNDNDTTKNPNLHRSIKQYHQMISLMKTLTTTPIPTTTTPPPRSLSHLLSHRLEKKILNRRSQLQSLGFLENDIRRAMRHTLLNNSLKDNDNNDEDEVLSLSSLLDRLCLTLSPEDLPCRFTEGELRDALEEGGIDLDRTTVGRNIASDNDGEIEEVPNDDAEVVAVPHSTTLGTKNDKGDKTFENKTLDKTPPNNDDDDNEQKMNKEWMLHHYQYESDNDDNNNNSQPPPPSSTITSPLHTELQELESKIASDTAYLNDDASSYLRSKHETKELKKAIEVMKKRVKKLKGKIEREEAKRREEEEEKNKTNEMDREEEGMGEGMMSGDNQEEEDDDGGGGLFSLFDDNDEEETTPTSAPTDDTTNKDNPSPPPPPPPSSPLIPPHWTGTTPQLLLSTHLRKLSHPPPKYTHHHSPPYHGCRLTLPSHTITATHTESYQDAKHVAALMALYKLSKGREYLVLPPDYRNLWLEWMREEREEKERRERVERGRERVLWEEFLAGLIDGVEGEVDEVVEQREERVRDDEEVTSKSKQRLPSSKPPMATPSPSIPPAITTLRQTLPIFHHRHSLLSTIQTHPVTILAGETGCGKSTQCPQYILESSPDVNVICTQPRRISAMALAERVSEERGETVGQSVGYAIRMERKVGERTRLLFCTTGVIVSRLREDPTLQGVTHVIVDEVHERQWQIDFLLVALRRLVGTARPDLTIILMSATLDTKLMSDYFHGAPVVTVPGRTFPVAEYYLEDILEETGYVIEEDSMYAAKANGRSGRQNKNNKTNSKRAELNITEKGGRKRREFYDLMEDEEGMMLELEDEFYEGYSLSTRRSMARVDEKAINYDLITTLLHLLLLTPHQNRTLHPPPSTTQTKTQSILLFLPGLAEIRTLHTTLTSSTLPALILPLHSSIPPTEQKKIFLPPPPPFTTKIILSTNIAETSLTIPDVTIVIDAGLVRENRLDDRRGTTISSLKTVWCSRANAKQRAGRAGRVQPGLSLKLYSRETQRKIMTPVSLPELKRVNLTEVCLSVIASQGGRGVDCASFLSEAPEPPGEREVERSLGTLMAVGALSMSVGMGQKGTQCQYCHLTSLGHLMAKFPLDVHLSKMLIWGFLFQCLDPVVTIAAGLSLANKSVFYTPFDEETKLVAGAAHRAFYYKKQKSGSSVAVRSDFDVVRNVYDEFDRLRRTNNNNNNTAWRFCKKHYLNYNTLIEMETTRKHLSEVLFNVFSSSNKNHDRHANDDAIIEAIVAAGLYPNICQAIKRTDHRAMTSSTINDRYEFKQGNERLYIHPSSVNHKHAQTIANDDGTAWLTYHEKFETSRLYLSQTGWIDNRALLLFAKWGGDDESYYRIEHLNRRVIIDDWIVLNNVPAMTAVVFREIRRGLEEFLRRLFDDTTRRGRGGGDRSGSDGDEGGDDVMRNVVDGIVELLKGGR